MAPRRIQLLEIGDDHLACGVFREKAGRLALEYWASEAIDSEWTASLQYFEQLLPRLAAFAAQQPKRACTLLLPGNLVFTKVVSKATDPGDAAARLTPDEHIPLPLPEVVWGCEELGGDDTSRTALIVAARKAQVERLCEVAVEAGLAIESVVPAAVGILGALVRPDAPTAIARLGARSTLLAAFAGSRRLVRTIPLGTHRADAPWERRVEGEIRRTLAHWVQTLGFPMPHLLRLAGEGGELTALSNRLANGPALPVENYDPFAAIESDLPAGTRGESPGPEMVGAACAILIDRDTRIDLSPDALKQERTTRHRLRLRYATAVLAVFALLPPVFFYRAQAAETQRRVQACERDLVVLTASQSANVAQLRQIEQLRERVRMLLPAYLARDGWSRFLAELQDDLMAVGDVWLERLQVVAPATGRSGATENAHRILIGGRLLESGAISASDRARLLSSRLATSAFVGAFEAEQFEHLEDGSLRFAVTLRLKPDWPL